jgi:hypothetical protein
MPHFITALIDSFITDGFERFYYEMRRSKRPFHHCLAHNDQGLVTVPRVLAHRLVRDIDTRNVVFELPT